MNLISEIKNDVLQCGVYHVKKGIYAVLVHDKYDRAMLFCRYQEFYESPFENIKGQPFDLMSYMRTYKNHKNSNVFTYPKDWMGYNIPSHSLKECLSNVFVKHTKECGINVYDYCMKDIVDSITQHLGSEKPFYILGVDNLESDVMEHEVAHGLFYTDNEYKEKTIAAYNKLPHNVKEEMKNILLDMGYCEEVIIDETQAYLSCGLRDEMSLIENVGENEIEFKNLFENYKN